VDEVLTEVSDIADSLVHFFDDIDFGDLVSV
jgi:hypothetical protein